MVRQQHRSFAQKKGIKYERAVQEELEKRHEWYLRNPWLYYCDKNGQHFCQPDGVLIDVPAARITIVEIKISHTASAWWQLRGVYLPVLSHIFPPQQGWEFRCVEVTHWYDPDVIFPAHQLIPCITQAPTLPLTGVHLYTPRRQREV